MKPSPFNGGANNQYKSEDQPNKSIDSSITPHHLESQVSQRDLKQLSPRIRPEDKTLSPQKSATLTPKELASPKSFKHLTKESVSSLDKVERAANGTNKELQIDPGTLDHMFRSSHDRVNKTETLVQKSLSKLRGEQLQDGQPILLHDDRSMDNTATVGQGREQAMRDSKGQMIELNQSIEMLRAGTDSLENTGKFGGTHKRSKGSSGNFFGSGDGSYNQDLAEQINEGSVVKSSFEVVGGQLEGFKGIQNDHERDRYLPQRLRQRIIKKRKSRELMGIKRQSTLMKILKDNARLSSNYTNIYTQMNQNNKRNTVSAQEMREKVGFEEQASRPQLNHFQSRPEIISQLIRSSKGSQAQLTSFENQFHKIGQQRQRCQSQMNQRSSKDGQLSNLSTKIGSNAKVNLDTDMVHNPSEQSTNHCESFTQSKYNQFYPIKKFNVGDQKFFMEGIYENLDSNKRASSKGLFGSECGMTKGYSRSTLVSRNTHTRQRNLSRNFVDQQSTGSISTITGSRLQTTLSHFIAPPRSSSNQRPTKKSGKWSEIKGRKGKLIKGTILRNPTAQNCLLHKHRKKSSSKTPALYTMSDHKFSTINKSSKNQGRSRNQSKGNIQGFTSSISNTSENITKTPMKHSRATPLSRNGIARSNQKSQFQSYYTQLSTKSAQTKIWNNRQNILQSQGTNSPSKRSEARDNIIDLSIATTGKPSQSPYEQLTDKQKITHLENELSKLRNKEILVKDTSRVTLNNSVTSPSTQQLQSPYHNDFQSKSSIKSMYYRSGQSKNNLKSKSFSRIAPRDMDGKLKHKDLAAPSERKEQELANIKFKYLKLKDVNKKLKDKMRREHEVQMIFQKQTRHNQFPTKYREEFRRIQMQAEVQIDEESTPMGSSIMKTNPTSGKPTPQASQLQSPQGTKHIRFAEPEESKPVEQDLLQVPNALEQVIKQVQDQEFGSSSEEKEGESDRDKTVTIGTFDPGTQDGKATIDIVMKDGVSTLGDEEAILGHKKQLSQTQDLTEFNRCSKINKGNSSIGTIKDIPKPEPKQPSSSLTKKIKRSKHRPKHDGNNSDGSDGYKNLMLTAGKQKETASNIFWVSNKVSFRYPKIEFEGGDDQIQTMDQSSTYMGKSGFNDTKGHTAGRSEAPTGGGASYAYPPSAYNMAPSQYGQMDQNSKSGGKKNRKEKQKEEKYKKFQKAFKNRMLEQTRTTIQISFLLTALKEINETLTLADILNCIEKSVPLFMMCKKVKSFIVDKNLQELYDGDPDKFSDYLPDIENFEEVQQGFILKNEILIPIHKIKPKKKKLQIDTGEIEDAQNEQNSTKVGETPKSKESTPRKEEDQNKMDQLEHQQEVMMYLKCFDKTQNQLCKTKNFNVMDEQFLRVYCSAISGSLQKLTIKKEFNMREDNIQSSLLFCKHVFMERNHFKLQKLIESEFPKFMGFQDAVVFYYDKKEDDFYRHFGSHDYENAFELIKFPKNLGMTGESAQRKKVIVSLKGSEDKRFKDDIDNIKGIDVRSIVVGPLLDASDSLQGVVLLYNKKTGEQITNEDLETLDNVLDVLGTITNNANEFNKVFSLIVDLDCVKKISEKFNKVADETLIPTRNSDLDRIFSNLTLIRKDFHKLLKSLRSRHLNKNIRVDKMVIARKKELQEKAGKGDIGALKKMQTFTNGSPKKKLELPQSFAR